MRRLGREETPQGHMDQIPVCRGMSGAKLFRMITCVSPLMNAVVLPKIIVRQKIGLHNRSLISCKSLNSVRRNEHSYLRFCGSFTSNNCAILPPSEVGIYSLSISVVFLT